MMNIYCIVVNITVVYSELFLNFIPRLRGMHTLMRFVGAISTLMADTGLELIMNVVFGGVSKMLIERNIPRIYEQYVWLLMNCCVASLLHMSIKVTHN